MADEQPASKKRRIRPSQAASQVAPTKRPEATKAPKKTDARSAFGAFLSPLRWLAQHLLPKYLRNSFSELRNVTWIGPKQSRQLTTAVILFAIVFGFLVSILDLGLDKVFKKVFLKE